MMYVSVRLLLPLVFVMMPLSTCSETGRSNCKNFQVTQTVLEGEALYFTHGSHSNPSKSNLTWYKNNTNLEPISSDKKERIHFYNSNLVFLDLLVKDSGFYTGWRTDSSEKCFNYNLLLKVLKASQRGNPDILYGEIDMPGINKRITCPQPVDDTCQKRGGTYSWYKNFSLIPGNQNVLWVYSATRENKDIYTCMCTWEYNQKLYNSSGSRELRVVEDMFTRLEIISPGLMELLKVVYEGQKLTLNCTVLCGQNEETECSAHWSSSDRVEDQGFKNKRYNTYTELTTGKTSKQTIATEILTIDTVTADDVHTNFTCTGRNIYTTESVYLRLKQGESIYPLAVTGACVIFFCLLAALLVKCFVIDLTLWFRPYIQLCSHPKDARFYDAYVVYQTQFMDKDTEDMLSQFLNHVLPNVLEEKCGYRLFIHGRDDIPGQDRVEMVEDNINKSRRLMVILSPDLGSRNESTDQSLACFNSGIPGVEWHDWQVVLHHALVQRELNVILIQLGGAEPSGYTHLPISLQHLIRKTAPLRWSQEYRGAAAWNSRFWKKVRYLMPTIPSKKCQQVV
ncbi:interleukin-1 receptor-like 1 [Cynoglossus semilaevis]|nr:interleukin-1 receptor-like 1 [Cynoglossus semilaevis]